MAEQAILVIDMQRGLVLGAHRQDELVETVNGLIARGRAAGLPVVFVQHNHATFEPMMRGNRGWEIFAALSHDYDVLLVADGHSTGDSDMPAAEIVRHHNAVLANMVHPSARIRVLAAAEVPVGG
jgi:nicotinamidase-related amidase